MLQSTCYAIRLIPWTKCDIIELMLCGHTVKHTCYAIRLTSCTNCDIIELVLCGQAVTQFYSTRVMRSDLLHGQNATLRNTCYALRLAPSIECDSTALNGNVSMDRIRPGGAQDVIEHALCDPAHSWKKCDIIERVLCNQAVTQYSTRVMRSGSFRGQNATLQNSCCAV